MGNGFLNNYFGFNKQQRNGLFVLLLISACLLVIRLVYPLFIKPANITLLNLPLIERKLDSNYAVSKTFSKPGFKNENISPSTLFVFDPNTVSLEQLLQLGLKEKIAQIFLKFRNKGFVFRQKKDLQKVYGISGKLYAQLEPYILIGTPNEKQFSERSSGFKSSETPAVKGPETKQSPVKVELNSADSSSLVALNGIGAGYAKRILKYRTILGGYVAVEQLKEVYGFSEELFEKVKDNFYVEVRNTRKINLNKDDFKSLNKHPYLTFELTKTIFDWRRKTTINPVNLKEILNDASLYQKLLPYLSFE